MLDTSALRALGYRASTDDAGGIGSTCDWLTAVATTANWRARFPVLAAYPYDLFDDAMEDDGLERLNAI